MNDHFLLEAVWVIFTWSPASLLCGLAVSLALVAWGSRCKRRRWRMAVLAVATLVLWIALFIAVESGYRAWQTMPNPPEEAFSDSGGPFAVLFMGWLPSALVLAAAHLLLRRIAVGRDTPDGVDYEPGKPR